MRPRAAFGAPVFDLVQPIAYAGLLADLTEAAIGAFAGLGPEPAPLPNFVADHDPRRLCVPYAPEKLARLREVKRT